MAATKCFRYVLRLMNKKGRIACLQLPEREHAQSKTRKNDPGPGLEKTRTVSIGGRCLSGGFLLLRR